MPSTYTTDVWDLKTPVVITPIYNNSGSVKIQLILGDMVIGTFPVYKDNKSQLVRNDIIAGIPFIVILDKTKTFFNIINGNYLSLTGGELSGCLTVEDRLAVRNDQNADLTIEKKSGDKSGYTIRRFDDDLFIYQSKNGATADNYIAQYDKSTDIWDFNIDGLSKKNVPVATINQLLGVGQKWFNMTKKRRPRTTYVNRTGKPIALSLWQADRPSDAVNIQLFVDGIQIGHMDASAGGYIIICYSTISINI